MRRAYRLLIVSLACGLLLSACGGAVRRVSEPAASIQQLTVRADGSWSVDLRLQNYSSIPMQFERVVLEISAGDQLAGKLDQSVGISIGPETADVVTVSVQPTSLGRLTVADVLAGGRSLPYSLKGTVWATPQDKKQRDFSVESRNTLSPAPASTACCADAHAFPHSFEGSRMSSYTAPLTDFRFALHDVLGAQALFARLGYADASTDIIDAVLEEAGRFTAQVLAPLNSVGDEIGCAFDKSTHAVTTPPGFRAAYDQFVAGGWNSLTAEPEFGGQGMPHTLGVPLSEMINSANLAWGNFRCSRTARWKRCASTAKPGSRMSSSSR